MFRAILSATVIGLAYIIAIPPAAADDRSVCLKAQGDDSIAACTRLLERRSKDDAVYYARGGAYLNKGDADRAMADYGAAISINPKNAFAYADRCLLYNSKGEFDRAIADCDQAIRLDSKLTAAWANRGVAYFSKQDYDRAVADCDQAVTLNSKYAYAYNCRGIGYLGKEDYDRALADFGLAISNNPNLYLAYVNRGNIYDLFKGEHDRAIADFNLAIKLVSKEPKAFSARGRAYNHKGEYDLAIADFSTAISLDPNALTYSGRGFAYGRKGDFDRAMADVNRAIALDPTAADGYVNRAAVHQMRGNADRAIADADEAIRLDSRNGAAYGWRGKAWFDKGAYDRAIADYDQALKLNPANDPGYAEAREGRARAVAALAAQQPAVQAPPRPAPLVAQAAPQQPPAVQAPPAPPPVVQAAPQPATVTAAIEAVTPAKPFALAPGQPARRALVIGINAYPNLGSAAQLERAVADAEAVGDRLANLGFQVTRLTSAQDTTLDAILRGFEAFRRSITPNDMVVLFYAGHGMGLSDGTYLVPSDVREASLEVETTAKRAAVNENELTDGLQRARAGIVVAVIDACRNDLFSRAARRAMGNERGLRPVETEGIFKLYSASEGQTALDRLPSGDGSKNSVFTRVFLKAIGTPGLNLSALGTSVRDEVYRLARSADHAQVPAVYDKLIGSTQVFVAGEAAAADAARGR